MKHSERVLAASALGAGIVFGGWRLIQSSYVEPRRELVDRLAAERSRLEEFQLTQQLTEAYIGKNWPIQTARTFDQNPQKAHDKFREEVARLIDNCGLREGHKLTQLQPKSESKKDSPRAGFIELPLSVSVEGRLEQLVDLVRGVHAMPCFARVNSIIMTPQNVATTTRQPISRRRDASAGGSTRLKMELNVSTLSLPTAPGYAYVAYDPSNANASPPRKPLHKDEEYSEIARVDWFKPYEPPAPPPVERHPETQVARAETKPLAPPPPTVDPRKDAGKKFLVGTEVIRGEPVAFVRDDAHLTQPPKEIRPNEPFDDGTLLLVHATGVVARDAKGVTYFYALGKSWAEREELNASANPDHADAARELALCAPGPSSSN